MEDNLRINSAELVCKIIKEQNRLLLEYIAKRLDMTEEQKEQLFDKFWKIQYYCPRIVISTKAEKIQKYMAW